MAATSVELIEELSDTLGVNESTCANSYRELRAADLVTVGGRGRNAAKMTARDAVMLLLAVCGSEHVKDSADAARRYSELHVRPVEMAEDHERNSRTAWQMASQVFPYLSALKQRHTLLEATVALVNSYTDEAIVISPNQPRIAPLIKLSVRGPNPSATITVSAPATDEVHYSPVNARDMFRSVLNPVRQRAKIRGPGDLRIEKHISHTTLASLGELLRGDDGT